MRRLLDTNVVSDFVRGEPGVVKRLRASTPGSLAVSTITMMEVAYGLERNPARAARLRPMLEALFGVIHVLAFDAEDASETGRVRALLEARGRPIGLCDAMLAGTARRRGLTMVSGNLREFGRIPGLRVEDWRTPA